MHAQPILSPSAACPCCRCDKTGRPPIPLAARPSPDSRHHVRKDGVPVPKYCVNLLGHYKIRRHAQNVSLTCTPLLPTRTARRFSGRRSAVRAPPRDLRHVRSSRRYPCDRGAGTASTPRIRNRVASLQATELDGGSCNSPCGTNARRRPILTWTPGGPREAASGIHQLPLGAAAWAGRHCVRPRRGGRV